MFAIELGQKVKDMVTGFTGIATARTEWMNGCVRYCVEAKMLKDGRCIELWVDEDRLELVGARKKAPAPLSRPGGSRNDSHPPIGG